jgi:hypothetical protein
LTGWIPSLFTTRKPTNHPTNQETNQPDKQTTNQPTIHPFIQPTITTTPWMPPLKDDTWNTNDHYRGHISLLLDPIQSHLIQSTFLYNFF